MIITSRGHRLYEVRLALLSPLGPGSLDKARYFSSSEQLIPYLKERPNQKFSLFDHPSGLGKLLAPDFTSIDAYGSDYGDVLCGDEVYYDSVKDRILTFTQIGRMWAG